MKFVVEITNTTPIFSAAPGAGAITLDGQLASAGRGFPYIRQRRMKVVKEQEDGTLQPVAVPVVPGNTMRNLLRRTMLKHFIEPALAGEQISIGAYAAAYAGNATGNPEGLPATFDETVLLRKHPFLGLFGGGPRFLQGRLKVDFLWPIHSDTARVLGEGYEGQMIAGHITDTVWTRRVDPVQKMKDEDSSEAIRGGSDAVNGWVTDLLKEAQKAAKKKGTKTSQESKDGEEAVEVNVRGLNAFNAHEVVVPGVNWVWRFSVDQPTDAQVGLILAALTKMQSERIAGGNAKDYGEFRINNILVDGESVWTAGQMDTNNTEHYLDAFAQAIDEMSASEFEQFVAGSKQGA
ncbi:MAG: type IV CRISPR-associated protein Csf2 [Natronospirillum sp.]|uniref:type IV CRISPR-associated protein Csf2 n=1 Tax=Natronospirillum sp. TaxID=2812955 RepID=UPI0025CFC68F|nr:type IV CRISPR-associated protein Csf2 [Natronospirillum sp.]MCH8552938.1 type IV CRISPR-associated protein Csf2 [Natronospirillum sp.]